MNNPVVVNLLDWLRNHQYSFYRHRFNEIVARRNLTASGRPRKRKVAT